MTSKSTDSPKPVNRKMLEPLDEFRLVLRQTNGRDNIKIFTGVDCDTAAVTYCSDVLGNGGIAWVLKPDRAFTAPEKPVATEVDLGGK